MEEIGKVAVTSTRLGCNAHRIDPTQLDVESPGIPQETPSGAWRVHKSVYGWGL